MSLVDGGNVQVTRMYREEMQVEFQLTDPEAVKLLGP